jgi:hypothetical protein
MRTLQAVGTCGAVALALVLAAPAVAQEAEPMAMDGTLTGDHWIDPLAPACDQPETSWRFYNTGTGELAGVGAVEAFSTHCTIFDEESGGANSTYYHRSTVFTTADGDTISVVHDIPTTEVFVGDDGNFTGFTLDGTWEAVGGTGRFVNANGSGTLFGAAEIPGPIAVDFTGEISLEPPPPPPAE